MMLIWFCIEGELKTIAVSTYATVLAATSEHIVEPLEQVIYHHIINCYYDYYYDYYYYYYYYYTSSWSSLNKIYYTIYTISIHVNEKVLKISCHLLISAFAVSYEDYKTQKRDCKSSRLWNIQCGFGPNVAWIREGNSI